MCDVWRQLEVSRAMQKLYNNLMTTDAETLLDLSKPAFDFVDENQFNASLWSEKLLDAIILASALNKVELMKIFKLILPKLAEGWLRQCGNVFGFSDYNQNSTKLLINIDSDVLNKAPINNMDADRWIASTMRSRSEEHRVLNRHCHQTSKLKVTS